MTRQRLQKQKSHKKRQNQQDDAQPLDSDRAKKLKTEIHEAIEGIDKVLREVGPSK